MNLPASTHAAAYLFAALCLFPLISEGQINDCSEARVVCTSANQVFNPQGPGLDDFADPDNDPGCLTALEQNSAWYYFQINPAAPPDLVLGFIIHPNGGFGEDYDWALFGPNVNCGDLGSPIRCSSSSAACGFCPETGMGMGTTDFTEGPGTGDGFVSTLVVQPGQGFYLLIDNWLGTTNGFILEWTDSAAEYLNCDASPPCALYAVAGPDLQVCEGDTDIPLNGSSTGNNGNESYSWTGTNGGTGFLSDPDIASPTVDLPSGFVGVITYTLTVSEDTCMHEDELNLIVNPLPIVTINPIGPFCANDLPQALSATPGGGTWGGAATGNTFNPVTNGPGIHTVTYSYTNFNNCTTIESVDIEVYDIPDATIDPDPAEFCDSENNILLTATGSGGAGSYEYNWTTPTGMETGPTYTATISGAHSVVVTDANGCTNSAVTTVTAHPNPDVEIVNPGPICESTEYLTITAIPPGGTFEGAIISPDGDMNPNTIDPGTYTISYTYTDGNNCEGSTTANLTIIAVPEIIATNNGPLCSGQPVLLFGETTSTGADIMYNWDGPGGFASNNQNPTNATLGGEYYLEVIVDGCPSEIAVTTVVVSDMPEAFAQNGGPYCLGQNIQLFGSTNASGSEITYAWTGPNGYISDIQNPSNATDEGTYSLIVTVDGCASGVVTTEVEFNTPPDASAANDGPYCHGNGVALFGSTTTTGTIISYAWSGPNGYSSPLQNPMDASLPGVYQLIVTVDGCQSTPTPTNVIFHALPQPVITGPNSFCTGNAATLNAGAGYTTYEWENGTQNQTLVVTNSGTYHVTVSDANGCIGDTSFTISEIPSLTPIISGNLAFCEGSGTTLDAGAGFVGYDWSTGESTQTITVTSNGNFGVIVTDADGCTGSANVTTIENDNPIVTIGGSTTYCIGGFTTLDAGAGYNSYNWNDGSTTQTITVSAPGNFTVDVIDANGCSGSGAVTITESTSLSPVITGNNAFCENGNTTLNAGSGFDSYLWSDGSNNQTLLIDTAGTYAVTVSDGQGCSGETSVAVTEVLPPSAQLQSTFELCNTIAGGSILNLYDLILSGDATGSWTDTDGSGAVGLFTNLNFNNVDAGDYRFTYTTNSAVDPCPETMYMVVVTVIDCTCPDVFFYNTDPLCNAADALDLSSLENTMEPGSWSLLQTPPGSNPATLTGTLFDAANADAGAYTLQFDLLNPPPPGCPLDFQIIVDVDASVDAGIAAQPIAFCATENQSVQLADLITDEDTNGIWSETSSFPSQGGAFNVVAGTFTTGNQVPGTYTFDYTLTSIGACPDDASTVVITINPLPMVVIEDVVTLDCNNPVQSLDATGSSFGPEYESVWTGPGILMDGNENTLQPTIDQQGNYQLTITQTQTGCSNSASVDVLANTDPPTSAWINHHGPSCFGDQNGFITIDQVIGGNEPYQYSLNGAPYNTNDVFSDLTAGDYTLSIEDVNGCQWDTTITLASPTEFNIQLMPDSIELGLGEHGMVQAITNLIASQIDTLIWSPDNIIECIDLTCLEANVYATNSVILSATLYDVNGCSVTDDIMIVVSKDRRVYIPNVFSPNNDGINDLFFIFGDENQIVNIQKFVVYSRWGEVVHQVNNFDPNDPSTGWDGTMKNEALNTGVFIYAAEVEFIDGVVKLYTGDVTLMR